jgi:hypothetical protein
MGNETNSLGLDFDSAHSTVMQPDEPVILTTGPSQGQDLVEDATAPSTESSAEHPKPSKLVPYINPQRVNTGGLPRVTSFLYIYLSTAYDLYQVKLSEQELAERMALRRKENEKRKERDLVCS